MQAGCSLQSELGVAPFTGAWIEIYQYYNSAYQYAGRTLHGCVD